MPQDSLRSVVYRSLVPCDDPNGVVEHETTRKSKTNSRKMGHKIDNRRARKDSNLTSICKEDKKEMVSKGIRDGLQAPPPIQILEVSRGAQKLNQMVDSWSSGTIFDGQSKDIAKDLLKGALDLQESLIMLCKLQEASKDIAQLKRKQKLKPEDRGFDEMGDEKIYSERVVEKSYQKGLQNPRISVDGSSRDCIGELKMVIRESLTRQNFLSIPSSEGKTCFTQRKLDSVSDIPSTSSSQSSMVHSNNSVSTAQQKMAKAPNLIAKLMGLEQIPSEPIQIHPQLPDKEMNSNQRRPIFDIEMPKVRNPSFVDRSEDPERRTLKEIIETMQLKGLLKHRDVEGLKLQSHLSDTTRSKQRLDHEMPPIVIMKPSHFPYQETEGTVAGQVSRKEGDLYLKKIKKLEVQEEPLNKTFVKEKEALGIEEVDRKVEANDEPTIKTSIQDRNAVELEERAQKVEPKKDLPTRRFTREEGALKPKEKLKKHEEKEAKSTEKASPCKMKASVPTNHKPQKKEPTNKKASIIEKASVNRKNPVEKENTKSVSVSRSQEQIRAISTKSRKPEDRSIIPKNRIQRQESTMQDPIPKRTIKPMSHKSIDRTKKNRTAKAKQMTESLAINTVTDSLQCKDGDKDINPTNKMDSISTTTSTSLADQLPTEEGIESPNIQNEDHREPDQSSLFKVTTQIIEQDSGIKLTEESKQLMDQKTTSKKTAKTELNLKDLLLNSPSFLSCAEDLFDLKMNQPEVFQTTGFQDIDMIDSRIFLDCANEIMEQKSRLGAETGHLLTYTTVSKADISVDQLMEEVCEGVEVLRSYSKVGDDVLPIDSIYKMLQSDLNWKGMQVSSVWDLGWLNGFSLSEADQVVGDVEKMVLSGLIEEIIIDFPNSNYSFSSRGVGVAMSCT